MLACCLSYSPYQQWFTVGQRKTKVQPNVRDSGERGLLETWANAYRTVWRYASASVSSSNSRSSSLFS